MFISHAIHHLFGALLLAVTLADVFFLRSASSEAVDPRVLMQGWRKKIALAEMFLFLVVFGLGLSMWIPHIKSYPAHVFHTKAALAVVYLVLAKVRMLKERRSGRVSFKLTKVMGFVVFTLFVFGIWGGLGG